MSSAADGAVSLRRRLRGIGCPTIRVKGVPEAAPVRSLRLS